MNFSDGLDSVIGVFSPKWAAYRKYYRSVLGRSSNQYAAAKTNRMTGDWSPTSADVNDIISASSATVRNRVRQLVRDFPYFARALNILVDYTVGEGIVYQSRMKDFRTGQLMKKANQFNEDVFNRWADEADVAGKLHLYELMGLAKRQDAESGEFVLVKNTDRSPGRYLPLCYHIYEPDWLSDLSQEDPNSNTSIEQGIEYETSTGRVKAFWFYNPSSYYTTETERIEASRVIHGFKTLRPGQLRGISAFAPGVLIANDLHAHMDATLDQAKMASKWLAFITTPDPTSRQLNVETDDDTLQKIDEIENGIIEYLRPGETIDFKGNPHPGSTFDPFVRLILMMFSVVSGAPYELVSGDYRGMNYNTGRTSRNDFAHQLKPVIKRHVRQFCQPILADFFESAVMAGRLPYTNYFNNPAPYLSAHWQGPGQASIDPLKETKAHLDQIKGLLNSPQRICREQGRDYETIIAEQAEAKQMAEDAGLTWGQATSTAIANAPSAVEKQGDNTDDDEDENTQKIMRLKHA